MKHVSRHVRVGVLINSYPGGRVLHVEHDNSFFSGGLTQLLLHFISEFNQLFALPGTYFEDMHKRDCNAKRKSLIRLQKSLSLASITTERLASIVRLATTETDALTDSWKITIIICFC